MNRFTTLKIIAALFAIATLTGCSLLKVSVATGDPLSKADMNTRTMTRGFYYDFSDEVARTADSIIATTPNIQRKLAAIRWKIQATRAGVSAATQSIPDVSLADIWILCRRMDEALAAAPDSLLFGKQSQLARDAATRLSHRAERLAHSVLKPERYTLMVQFIDRYIKKNTTTELGTTSPDTAFAWLEYLREKGIEHGYATGSISEVLADMGDKMSGQTRQISNSLGWSKDMLELQLQQDSIRAQLGRQVDSLERNFNRLVTVAEHLPQISDHLIATLNSQVKSLIYTLNYSVDNAFTNIDHQRDELQRYISSEREALVEQTRKAMDDTTQHLLDALPALIGKVLLYVVLALVVLLGLPFAAGFWLGGLRQRTKEGKK